ncbi:hypothetical protein V8E36_004215 [Tilletia maclaganii]
MLCPVKVQSLLPLFYSLHANSIPFFPAYIASYSIPPPGPRRPHSMPAGRIFAFARHFLLLCSPVPPPHYRALFILPRLPPSSRSAPTLLLVSSALSSICCVNVSCVVFVALCAFARRRCPPPWTYTAPRGPQRRSPRAGSRLFRLQDLLATPYPRHMLTVSSLPLYPVSKSTQRLSSASLCALADSTPLFMTFCLPSP